MNTIDLSQLPRCSRGIDWQAINNITVFFKYKDISDNLIIIKHINQDFVLISYKNTEYKIKKDMLKKCQLGFIFNFSIKNNYKYHIDDIIPRTSGKLKILSKTRSESKTANGIRQIKAYNVKCIICEYSFIIREGNLSKGNGCPVCSNRVVKVGYNDLWTTNPDECLYLTNSKDGYLYTKNSNTKIDLTCPHCKKYIGKRSVYDLTHNKVSCHKCGDGISYPNKFLYNLLDQLNENFNTEITFNWCKFPFYNNKNKICTGIYDCVIPHKNLIIEMDSGLGHGRKIHSNSKISLEDSIYRDNMKTQLAIKNNYKIIRINCEYYGNQSPYIACYNGIINSELTNIYDLSNINWELINKNSQNNKLLEACQLYDNGVFLDIIANKLHVSKYTVKDYLKRGSRLNICSYKLNTRRKK